MERRSQQFKSFQDNCLFELSQLFGAPENFKYSRSTMKKFTTLQNNTKLQNLFRKYRNFLEDNFQNDKSMIEQQYNYLPNVAKLYFNY